MTIFYLETALIVELNMSSVTFTKRW